MAYLGAWPFHQLAFSLNTKISLKRTYELTIHDIFGSWLLNQLVFSPNTMTVLNRVIELTINDIFGCLDISSACCFTEYRNYYKEGK